MSKIYLKKKRTPISRNWGVNRDSIALQESTLEQKMPMESTPLGFGHCYQNYKKTH